MEIDIDGHKVKGDVSEIIMLIKGLKHAPKLMQQDKPVKARHDIKRKVNGFKRWTRLDIAKVASLREKGFKVHKIAKMMGRSKSSIGVLFWKIDNNKIKVIVE